jgi:hypothetical protein
MNTDQQTKKGYVLYVQAFDEFFDRNKVNTMSSAIPPCDKCHVALNDDGECPKCGKQLGDIDRPESHFSWQACGCCGDTDGGQRENYIAFNIKQKADDPEDETEIKVSVCEDCVYFNEYHRLDDMAMLEIDKDECPAVVNGKKGTLVGPVDGRKLVFKDENNELSPVEVKDIEFPEDE